MRSSLLFQDFTKRGVLVKFHEFAKGGYNAHNITLCSIYNLYTYLLYVIKSYLKPKRSQFKYKFQSKNGSEDHVQHIQGLAVLSRLVVILHGEGDGVYHDEDEDGVLEGR